MAAMMRSLSSCLDETRIWRSTERVSLEKKPSTRLSQEPCLGVKVNLKRPAGCSASQALVSLEIIARLQSAGFNCASVQNPLTTLPEAVASAQRVLERQNGPTVLVGHSFSGMIVTTHLNGRF